MVDEKDLKKLIEKYQKQADAAELVLQKTWSHWHYTHKCTNQNLADALRIAMSAKEDHEALRNMKLMLLNFASRAEAATSSFRPESERVELALKLAEEIADYGRKSGLI